MAKTAGKKIKPCEICGGPRRGPTAHKSDCPNNPANKAGGTRARASKGGVSMTSFRGMGIEELIAVRGQIDTLIAGKAPELKAKIEALQATLDSIEEK